jgi:hypothetical protein
MPSPVNALACTLKYTYGPVSTYSTMDIDFHRVAFALHERSGDLPLKWWRSDLCVCMMLGLPPDNGKEIRK